MASLEKAINNNFLDSVLPTYGNPRAQILVWDEGQKMFIFDEYESASGHRYYRGVRFCDRIVIVENVGLYHSWTYIDSIELYAFNGQKLGLVQKQDYNKEFRNEEFVRKESETMVRNYLEGAIKAQRVYMPIEQLEVQVKNLINDCYQSFLEKDFNTRLTTNILPQLEQH